MNMLYYNFSEYPCPKCGGHWENVEVSDGTYIFRCDKCGYEKFRTQEQPRPLRSKEM